MSSLTVGSSPGIAFAKKQFRKYFEKEENFLKFHQHVSRLVKAPTVALTELLQSDIVEWLERVGEKRAARWFNDYWTGEHGNYTNATAGYVGNNMSSGIEAHWRYTRAATVGTSGTNQRVCLQVFSASLVRHMKTTSKRHAAKIVDEKTGFHIFPSLPTIPSSMWKEVQAFNTNRLVAAFVEGSDDVRRKWRDTMKTYFTCEADPPTPFTELVKRFHVAAKMPVPRTAIKGVVIPTDRYYNALTKANDGRRLTAQMMEESGDRQFYSSLFHRTAELATLDEYESKDIDIEDKLDALEDFDRMQPLPKKCGPIEATCTCSDSYRKMCCVETVVFSMLFNSELTVPSTKRGIQVKEKVKKKAMTPWSAEAEAAAKKKDKSKAPDPPSGIRVPPVPVWAPSIPTAKSLSGAPLQQVRVRFALYSSDSDWLR